MKTIGREILWNLPPTAAVVMYALFGVVLLVIAWGCTGGWKRTASDGPGAGEPVRRPPGPPVDTVRLALGQQRVWPEVRRHPPVHLLLLHRPLHRHLPRRRGVRPRFPDPRRELLHSLQAVRGDFGSLLVLGVAGALVRRIVFRPPVSRKRTTTRCSFCSSAPSASRVPDRDGPHRRDPSGNRPDLLRQQLPRAGLFGGMPLSEILSVHKALWWTHLLIAFGFLASLPSRR